jgi:hypothetical protein
MWIASIAMRLGLFEPNAYDVIDCRKSERDAKLRARGGFEAEP